MNCKSVFVFLYSLLFIFNKTLAQNATNPIVAFTGMVAKDETDSKKFFGNLDLIHSVNRAYTSVSSVSDLLVYINPKCLDTFQYEFNSYNDTVSSKQYTTIRLTPLGLVYLKLLKKIYGDSFSISNPSYYAYENSDIHFVKILGDYKLVSKKCSGLLNVTFSVKNRSIQTDDIVFTPFDYQHSDLIENLCAKDLELYRNKNFDSLLSELRKNNSKLKEKTFRKSEIRLKETHYMNPQYFSSRLYCADDNIFLLSIFQLQKQSNFLVFTYKSYNNRFELNNIELIEK